MKRNKQVIARATRILFVSKYLERIADGTTVVVRVLGTRENGTGQIDLAVIDQGIGIPEKEIPRLPERFYRVDHARSRELGGTGLGLAIVKHIVQAHQGSLRIDSHVNIGTTVTVRLPAASESA